MNPVSAMRGRRGAHGGSQAGQKAGQAQGHCHQSRGMFQHRGVDGQHGLQVKGESKLRKCQKVTGDLLFVCQVEGLGTGLWAMMQKQLGSSILSDGECIPVEISQDKEGNKCYSHSKAQYSRPSGTQVKDFHLSLHKREPQYWTKSPGPEQFKELATIV